VPYKADDILMFNICEQFKPKEYPKCSQEKRYAFESKNSGDTCEPLTAESAGMKYQELPGETPGEP